MLPLCRSVQRLVDKADNKKDLPDQEIQGESTPGVEGMLHSSCVSVKPRRLIEEM